MMLRRILGRLGYWVVDTCHYRPRARLVLRKCDLARDVLVQGAVKVSGPGYVRIGERVLFRRGIAPQELASGPGAEIIVGANTCFNYGAIVRAETSVRIGANCLIGSFARLDDAAQEFGTVGPIVVEDDVWIAHGAVIAPGVRIGRGSVVAAGSVVLSEAPPNTLAMGNPARCFPLELISRQETKTDAIQTTDEGQGRSKKTSLGRGA